MNRKNCHVIACSSNVGINSVPADRPDHWGTISLWLDVGVVPLSLSLSRARLVHCIAWPVPEQTCGCR